MQNQTILHSKFGIFFALLLAATMTFLTACGSGNNPEKDIEALPDMQDEAAVQSARAKQDEARLALAPSTPVPADNILRRGNGAEPQTLDPHRAEGVTASNVLRDLYEGLVTELPTGEFIPGAASEWSISDDGKVYTFTIRENAKWSNGDPVTAQDFVNGLRRSIDPATGSNYSQILEPILNAAEILQTTKAVETLGVKALSPNQLEIRLRAPTPYFLGLLTHSTTYPIHQASIDQHGDQFIRPGKHVTNGAYQLTEWRTNDYIAAKRNPNYWDNANTSIDTVYYYAIDNAETEFKAYLAGDLDMTSSVPKPRYDFARQNLAHELIVAPYLGTYYYGFNTQRPPLNSKPLRQALAMVINREVITDQVLKMGQIPAYGWVPPNVDNYTPQQFEWADWPVEKRVAVAKKLYKAAGYSQRNPAEIEILYNTSDDHKTIALLVGDMWKEHLGVKVKLRNQEWKTYLNTRKDPNQVQAFRAGWIGDYNDAYTFLEILQSTHGMNNEGYSNTRFDVLANLASLENDMEKRRDLMQRAEKILLEDAPIMPVYFYVSSAMVKGYVDGYVDNIQDHHYTKHLSLRR